MISYNYELTNEVFNENKKYKDSLISTIRTVSEYFGDNISDILRKLNTVQGEQYIQSACEISTIFHFADKRPNKIDYEPRLNDNDNLNCESIYHFSDLTLAIEVKTPDLTDIIGDDSSIQFGFAEPADMSCDDYIDFVDEIKNQPNFGFKRLLNWRLHQYLKDSNDKFGNNSKDSFNVLVVCIETASDFDNWIGYLLRKKGLFTKQSFVYEKMNSQQKESFNFYKNVDAVVLSSIQNHHKNKSSRKKSIYWKLDECFNICFTNPFSEKLIDNEEDYIKKYNIFRENYIIDYLPLYSNLLSKNPNPIVRYAEDCSAVQYYAENLPENKEYLFE